MQRTTTEKIEKFISEYETKIDRCYEKIKDLKKELQAEREKLNNTSDPIEYLDQVLSIEVSRKNLAVQKKKKDILVQAKSDFEDCL